VVDDQPAMRAGIRAVLDAAPDLQFVGEASETNELWPVLRRTDPDVVLVDFHLPGEDGLLLCHRIKRAPSAPRVVVDSAYADESLVAPSGWGAAAGAGASATLTEQLNEQPDHEEGEDEVDQHHRQQHPPLIHHSHERDGGDHDQHRRDEDQHDADAAIRPRRVRLHGRRSRARRLSGSRWLSRGPSA
jgi:chemotaxis response regulator CheB